MSLPEHCWEIIGGADKGGILVRNGPSLTSAYLPSRLSTGAIVEGLESVDDRLHYRLVSGSGPHDGWITTNLKGKVLARPHVVDKTSSKVTDKAGGRKNDDTWDPYKILGIPTDATDAVIKSAFRKASLKVHPDRNPSPEAAAEFRKLTDTKDFLLNPLKRLFYNMKHGLNQRVFEQWWSDWDQIFDEIDPDEDIDGDEGVSSPVPAPLTGNACTDILIFGATGIAGALACKMLHGPLWSRTWAIVGRDERKLKMVAEKFGDSTFFRGFTRVEDFADVGELVRSARVVVDFSGPKWKLGTNVAEACAKYGVHYVDNTMYPGDAFHARSAREKVDATAKSTGACLVYFCGYPTQTDFGVWLMVKHLREKYGAPTRRIDSYELSQGHMISGTSMLSFVGSAGRNFDNEVNKLGGTYLLGGLRPCGMREEDKDEESVDILSDPSIGMYKIFMPWQDRVVVRCSSGLLDEINPYGPNFLYKNWTFETDKKVCDNIVMGNVFLRARYEAAVAEKKIVPVGSGPKERMRREAMITRIFVGEADTSARDTAETERTAHFVMTLGPGNIGEPYECSSLIALEAAQCLLAQMDSGSKGLRPGFGTPVFHLAHLGFCEKLQAMRGWHMTEMRDGLPPRELFENVTQKTLQLES